MAGCRWWHDKTADAEERTKAKLMGKNIAALSIWSMMGCPASGILHGFLIFCTKICQGRKQGEFARYFPPDRGRQTERNGERHSMGVQGMGPRLYKNH